VVLPSLADLEDVEDRLGRDLETAEQRRADALLRDASVVVRNYTRRDFTLVENEVARYLPRGRKVVLPKRPVIAVNSVKAVIGYGTHQTITVLSFWSWVAGNEIILGEPSLMINGPSYEWNDSNVWAEVDYDHGFAEVPADIISVVANLVVRNLTVPKAGMIDMESVGPYSARYATFTASGPLGLGEADRQVLNRYRSSINHTVELRA